VLSDLQPKPSYVVLQTLTRELSGYHLLKRLTMDNDRDYALVFAKEGGEQKLVAWTLGEPHTAIVDAGVVSSTKLSGTKGNGERFEPKLEGQRLSLELATLPQYVTY
jgi:hypothetical protein